MIPLSELTWGEIRQNILKVIEMRKKGVYSLDITSTGGAVGCSQLFKLHKYLMEYLSLLQ